MLRYVLPSGTNLRWSEVNVFPPALDPSSPRSRRCGSAEKNFRGPREPRSLNFACACHGIRKGTASCAPKLRRRRRSSLQGDFGQKQRYWNPSARGSRFALMPTLARTRTQLSSVLAIRCRVDVIGERVSRRGPAWRSLLSDELDNCCEIIEPWASGAATFYIANVPECRPDMHRGALVIARDAIEMQTCLALSRRTNRHYSAEVLVALAPPLFKDC